MKNRTSIILVIALLVIALAGGIWYFFERSKADPVNPNKTDNYVELRKNIGTWAETERDIGPKIWVKIAQLHNLDQNTEKAEIQRRANAAMAWFKGYNLKADDWYYQSEVKAEVDQFYQTNPTATTNRTAVGQFIS